MNIKIRSLQPSDWSSVCSIFEQGIKTGLATFEVGVPSWEEWEKNHMQICRLVAEDNERIIGWAALTSVSHRDVYSGVAEESVYIAEEARSKGVGRILLQALIQESEKNGIWTLQAVILPEHKASIVLHESCDFRIVGYREKIGKLDGKWRNTLLMERRSKISSLN